MKKIFTLYILFCIGFFATIPHLNGIPLWALFSHDNNDIPLSAPIEFIGTTGGNSNGTASPVTNLPTNIEGDILLMIFSTDVVATANGTPPVGWTKIASHDAGTDGSGHIFWKRAGASESSPVTWTNLFTGSTSAVYECVSYRNCISSGSPIDVSQTGAMSASTSWSGSVTPTGNNRMLVGVFCADAVSGASFTWDSPTIERADRNNSGVGYLTIGERFISNSSTVVIGGTASANDSYVRFILALLPE